MKRFELKTKSEDSEAVDDTECWDMEEEICYERFGVEEIEEISEEEFGTDISAEDEGQSDRSLQVGQENLKKLPLETNESCANDAAMETCARDTASSDVFVKKDPVDDVGIPG